MKTIYEAIGGQPVIDKIVDAFYPKVYADEEIGHLFQGDMEEIKQKQRLFFAAVVWRPRVI